MRFVDRRVFRVTEDRGSRGKNELVDAIRTHAVEQHLGRRHIIPVIFRRVSNGIPHLDEAGEVHHCIRPNPAQDSRSEENTSELKTLLSISYAVMCLTNKT